MKRAENVSARRCSMVIAALLMCVLGEAMGLAQTRGLVSTDASSQKRVALVVGNNAYPQMHLENAVNDARAMQETLGRHGFEVQKTEDASLVELAKAVDAFIGRLGAGDVGLFFYAGHGIQIEGENYLVPVDFEAQDETVAKYKSFPAELVRERMEKTGARLSIIILDACRNNPFKMSRSTSRGLAAMNSGRGTLIAFATGPGKTASDSSVGKNGLFTHHLVGCLGIPGLSLDAVFNRVRAQVDQESSHQQTPWVVSSVIGDFFFQSGAPAPVPKVEAPAPAPDAKVDYSDLEQLAARRQQWSAYLDGMKSAYSKARQLDESSDLKPPEKAQLWERFLQNFQVQNSQDDADKPMREFASKRINYWKGPPAPQAVVPPSPPPKPTASPPAPQAAPAADAMSHINTTVRSFFASVQNKNVDQAIGFYAAAKRPKIKRSVLETAARETEYYKVDKVNPIEVGESSAKVKVCLYHKKRKLPVEYWEGDFELVREQGEWRLVSTPGKKVR